MDLGLALNPVTSDLEKRGWCETQKYLQGRDGRQAGMEAEIRQMLPQAKCYQESQEAGSSKEGIFP